LRFSKDHRLLAKADYKLTFDQPYKISQKHLLILFKPNQKKLARLGLIVGKRVAAQAVTRNTIKRVIRESFRINKNRLRGIDIVVIARQHCDTLNKAELREGINKLWEKLITQYQTLLSS
jgi:ribonuclease P protein component